MKQLPYLMTSAVLCLMLLCLVPSAGAGTLAAAEASLDLVDSSVLSLAELETLRGGDAVPSALVNQVSQNADLNNNSVDSSITGDNRVGDTAFSGVHGIPTLIQNTGNNVIIQNSTIVNFHMEK